jgi:hypothetical protein
MKMPNNTTTKPMGKTKLKIDIMVGYIKENHNGYNKMPPRIVRSMVRHKFKCSEYLSKVVAGRLLEGK